MMAGPSKSEEERRITEIETRIITGWRNTGIAANRARAFIAMTAPPPNLAPEQRLDRLERTFNLIDLIYAGGLH